jgi:hypothetical protein
MYNYTEKIGIFAGVRGGMKEEKDRTMKEAIKLYYGETGLSADDSQKVEEILQSMDISGYREECPQSASPKERSIWHIGSLQFSKAACLITIVCVAVGLCGFSLVMGYINRLKVKELDNHTEVTFDDRDMNGEEPPKVIENCYEPVWVPEGFEKEYEGRTDTSYAISYRKGNKFIDYSQIVTWVKTHYGAEHGKSENVAFGEYSGVLIEDSKWGDTCYYLIVTDGKYVYDLISSDVDKETLIKMLCGE